MNDDSSLMGDVVHLDDPTTCPEELEEFVRVLANDVNKVPEFTPDLRHVLPDRRVEFLELAAELRFVAYHCARLLHHEVKTIEEAGLRCLTEGLVDDKIDHAHASGHLTTEYREQLRKRNCFANGNATGPEGKVCLVAGETALDDDRHGLAPFSGGWGGEAMNGYPRSRDLAAGKSSIREASSDPMKGPLRAARRPC